MTESLSSLPATTPISLSSSSQDWCPEDAHRTLRISVWHLASGSPSQFVVWSMVVMDESKYEPFVGMVLSTEEEDKVRYKATQVINKSHEGKFVHGDIRDINLFHQLCIALHKSS
jgi:hypothetical protein